MIPGIVPEIQLSAKEIKISALKKLTSKFDEI